MEHFPYKIWISLLPLILSASLLPAQQAKTGESHRTEFSNSAGDHVELRANTIERGTAAQTLHLEGSVQVKVTVCRPDCTGSVIVHADAAEYHLDSGELDPHGNVRVTPGPVN